MRKSCHEAITITGDINIYIYIYIYIYNIYIYIIYIYIYIYIHTSDRHNNDFMAFMATHLLGSYNI